MRADLKETLRGSECLNLGIWLRKSCARGGVVGMPGMGWVGGSWWTGDVWGVDGTYWTGEIGWPALLRAV